MARSFGAAAGYLLFLLAACSDDPTMPPPQNSPDAGVIITTDAGVFVPPQIATPAAPAEPQVELTQLIPDSPLGPTHNPCPIGWRMIAAEDTDLCEPWPETGRTTCPEDQAHFPGEPGCRVIGTPCDAASNYATGLPASRILYVTPGATSLGTGTRDDPFHRIADAIAIATPGTTIALAQGTFDEIIRLPANIVLWGACTASTIIASSEPHDTEATIQVRGRGAQIKNLRITGARPGISSVSFNSGARIQDVIIEGALTFGLLIGGSVDAYSLVIRGPALGARIAAGGRMTLRGGVITGFTEAALWYDQLASGDLTGVFLGDASGTPGVGLTVGGAATVEARDLAIEETALHGLYVEGARTELHLHNAIIRSSRAFTKDQLSTGAWVRTSAILDLAAVRIQNIGGIGVLASDEDTELRATDLLISDTTAAPADGFGLYLDTDAIATIERVLVARSASANIAIASRGKLTATDLTLAGGSGLGIISTDGALELTRADLGDHRSAGIILVNGSLVASHTRIHDTTSEERDPELALGEGLIAASANVVIERSVIEKNRAGGIVVGASNVRLSSVRVSDNYAAEDVPGAHGQGALFVNGSSVTIDRALFYRNSGANIQARDRADEAAATRLRLSDVVLRQARRGHAPSLTRGYGMAVNHVAGVELRRVSCEENGLGLDLRDVGDGVNIEDLSVSDTSGGPVTDGGELDGVNIFVAGGGESRIARARFAEGSGPAMILSGVGGVVEDLTVLGMKRAVEIDSSTITISRAFLEGSAGGGMIIFGSLVELEDLLVRDAHVGVAGLAASTVNVRRFEVSGNEVCGLQLAEGSAFDLLGGVVQDNAVGVSVGVEGFDLGRLMRDVYYFGNEKNIDSAGLPIPVKAGSIPAL